MSKKSLTEEQRVARRKAVKEYNQRNPGKTSAKKKRYRKRNPLTIRGQRLKKRYGIDNAQYDLMVATQEGKCAVCKLVPKRLLVVDHNHSTNSVRELLCDGCNQGLGMFKESIASLEAAIDYLRKHYVKEEN